VTNPIFEKVNQKKGVVVTTKNQNDKKGKTWGAKHAEDHEGAFPEGEKHTLRWQVNTTPRQGDKKKSKNLGEKEQSGCRR